AQNVVVAGDFSVIEEAKGLLSGSSSPMRTFSVTGTTTLGSDSTDISIGGTVGINLVFNGPTILTSPNPSQPKYAIRINNIPLIPGLDMNVTFNDNITNSLTNTNSYLVFIDNETRQLVYTNFIGSTVHSLNGAGTTVRVNTNVLVQNNWVFNTHFELKTVSATVKDFVIVSGSFNLGSNNLTAIGAMHCLNYGMASSSTPYPPSPQIINWCLKTLDTVYVDGINGNNAYVGDSWATAKQTIAGALSVVATGGVVMISNNTTYTEKIVLNRRLSIQGAYFPTPGLPTRINSPVVADPLNDALLDFQSGSNGSSAIRLDLRHDATRMRRGVVIREYVKNIYFANNHVYTLATTSPYSGNPDPDDNRVYQLNARVQSTYMIRSNLFYGTPSRMLGLQYSSGTDSASWVGGPAKAHENIIHPRDTSISGSPVTCFQHIWMAACGTHTIQNNTTLGTSEVGVDLSNISPVLTNQINILDNTFSHTPSNLSGTSPLSQLTLKVNQMVDKLILVQNNTFNVQSGRKGIRIEGSRNINIIQNVFNAPVAGSYTHIEVDNQTTNNDPGRPSANIWGNTFNSTGSSLNVGSRAIFLRRSNLLTAYDYLGISLSGTPNNVYGTHIERFIDCQRNLGPAVATINVTTGNTFPTLPNGDFDIEDRIVHTMDDPYLNAERRPYVFWNVKRLYVTNQHNSIVNIEQPIPVDNRSIQDAVDLIPNGQNDWTIHVKNGTYITTTGVEDTVKFNKPLFFAPEGFPGTIVDRHFVVNLPNAADSVRLDGNFQFGNAGNSRLMRFFTGDWVLNGNYIIFDIGCTLQEAPGQLFRGQTGYIQTTRNLNAPSNLNVAGFGAALTTTVNLGSTVIRRGHTEHMIFSTPSIWRYFDINPTNNTGLNATLTFYYDNTELNGLTASNLAAYRTPTPPTGWVNMGGTPFTGYLTKTGIASFSRWTLADANPLPVELLDFSAKLENDRVRLNWSTASERNNAHFTIERSKDA
ncbi:MAG: hypothetical protein NZ108_04390, partial [Bacteroidia bacterium]|nr:hypothetical protein [Bacteroidia bacterium]